MIPCSSISTAIHFAWNISKISTQCTNVGDSTKMTSPGLINTWQIKFIVSKPPFTIKISSGDAFTPFGASNFFETVSLKSFNPIGWPYCSASTPLLSNVKTSFAISLTISTGNASFAGAPPPKEIISEFVIELNKFLIIEADFSISVILCAYFGILNPPSFLVFYHILFTISLREWLQRGIPLFNNEIIKSIISWLVQVHMQHLKSYLPVP